MVKAPDGNKLAILHALKCGEFVSGQALGEQLGISRAAVSKHIKSLQQMGIDIFKVTGKGYRLNNSLPLLEEAEIRQSWAQLSDTPCQIEVHSIIDSTNSELMRRIQAHQSIPKGQVLVAEMQQAGRGRRGRQWQSPFGANLYYSCYWQLDEGMQAAMGLSIAVGLAVHDALKALFDLDVQLKWPNDVYLNEQKLAGILVELDGQVEGPCHLVIGIGLNVAMPESAAGQIDQAWTDLSQHVNAVNKNQLVAVLTLCLQKRLEVYQRHGLSVMTEQWNALNVHRQQAVTLTTGQKQWRGICEGIDLQGGLVLRQDGELKTYYGGEISVRKEVS
ncbi:bifunctional biotin--[acetyl-CoA-carboxylase] ligase/biotin operon repressor BirA [Pseudoalteromonas rubra]|uniref:Bifunctional ligase/repressor BirA n=1 Tax=Pseudoalteromonas rubra TaxID=43658 RepID=A0A0F4QJW2_9GAMM|nr:bifunctional biotin--[acetyl-CoA-carboxylase] ligase/biotin operon repressor BirA [Pseudoalteromonas rubra]KJZ07560.1 biotin--[acetyl-CoA-carboxylase] synthetase [Pseudoalteromonas rubra]